MQKSAQSALSLVIPQVGESLSLSDYANHEMPTFQDGICKRRATIPRDTATQKLMLFTVNLCHNNGTQLEYLSMLDPLSAPHIHCHKQSSQ